MSKRVNGEVLDDESPVEKRLRLDELHMAQDASELDQDAEWEAFQALIADGTGATDPAVEAETKLDIELDADEESEGEEQGVTNTWDEDDVIIEKRLEEQEARKKYLADLRAQRDQRVAVNVHASTEKADTRATSEQEITRDDSASEEEEEEDLEEGWIH